MTLPKITPRQQDILKLLYTHRFLNRIQIQALMGHKDYSKINMWLADLSGKDYVERTYSTDYAQRTRPAVYNIGINGVRYLKTRDDCAQSLVQRLYREKSRSDTFRADHVLLGDCAANLRAQSLDGVNYVSLSESDFAMAESPYHLIADTNWKMLFIKQTPGNQLTYLLDIIDPTLPRYRARARLRSCIKFYDSGDWEDETSSPFPVLLFICWNKPQLIAYKRYMRYLLAEGDHPDDLRVRFATQNEVKNMGVTGEVWEEA